MNMLKTFEARMDNAFSTHPAQERMPFSFKKLAKHAVKELERETYSIAGTKTAPALFTILISAQDDMVMKPLYKTICSELGSCLETHARTRNYSLVGSPLVRFMVDPKMRRGKFSLFAENIDAMTLANLRFEEEQFLGLKPSNNSQNPAAAARESALDEESRGLNVIPADFGALPMNPTPFVPPVEAAQVAQVPQTQRRSVALVNNTPKPEPVMANCLLIDRSTGQTYTASAPSTILGREHRSGYIVLDDPNISRRHAELSYDGRSWHITDLHSTNGTMVNNRDIDTYTLSDGDLITIGLLNLEFRGN